MNAYAVQDTRHQLELDEQAEWQDWKDGRLACHHARYLEDGDLSDAISTGEGIERGRAIYKAFRDGDTDKGIRLIGEAMEIAAQEYAAENLAYEERFAEIAKREGVALIRAGQRGRVPSGYDD